MLHNKTTIYKEQDVLKKFDDAERTEPVLDTNTAPREYALPVKEKINYEKEYFLWKCFKRFMSSLTQRGKRAKLRTHLQELGAQFILIEEQVQENAVLQDLKMSGNNRIVLSLIGQGYRSIYIKNDKNSYSISFNMSAQDSRCDLPPPTIFALVGNRNFKTSINGQSVIFTPFGHLSDVRRSSEVRL